MKFNSLFILISLALLLPSMSMAAPSVNTEDNPAGLIAMDEMVADKTLTAQELKTLMKEEKKQVRMDHRMARVQKFMNSKMGQKLLGGLDDPIDKWFWFWVIGTGAGFLLLILAPYTFGFNILAFIGLLLLIAGGVSGVIWLVKKLA